MHHYTGKALHVHVASCLFIALLTSLAASPATAAVTRYYRFETDNGSPASDGQTLTVADDSSGNNRTGTPMGSPKYAATPFPNPVPGSGAVNQFSLLGGTGNGVLLDGTAAPILAPTFTVESFFRLTSTDPNTGDVKPILRVGTPGAGVLSLELLNLNGSGGTNDLLLVMSNDNLELRAFDLSPNTNYHVAATYDGANARLYVDGALVDSANFAGFTGSGTFSGAIGNDTLGAEAFRGNIDELRISDVALTPQQFLDAVPEPVCLSLVALGAVPLLRRYRRVARCLIIAALVASTANMQAVPTELDQPSATKAVAVASAVLAGPIVNPANGHSYFLLPPDTWTASEAEAEAMGGTLATIRSSAENSWVFDTFGSGLASGGALWVGYRRTSVGGPFSWVSGETATYTNWAPGEPNFPDEQFTYLLPSGNPIAGQWNNDYDRSSSTYTSGAAGGTIGPYSIYGVAELVPEPSVIAVAAGFLLPCLLRRRSRTASRQFADT
jgi:hypothetical protein